MDKYVFDIKYSDLRGGHLDCCAYWVISEKDSRVETFRRDALKANLELETFAANQRTDCKESGILVSE